MERSLELYHDGRLYEIEDGLAIEVTETQGQVEALLTALRFSTATTFTIPPLDQQPPEVNTRRSSRHIQPEGVKLLTTFEGVKLTAYDDGRGVWTIGYGHTQNVRPGMTISQAQAEEWLAADLAEFESYVEKAVKVQLNANQFSALVCFCFNVGPGSEGFGGSTLLKLLNAGDYAGAANQFPRWNKVEGKPWLGLTRRRLAERSLFLGNPWQPFLNYERTGEEIVQGIVSGISKETSGAMRSLKLTNPVMQGEDVRQIQMALQKAGMKLEPDGFFGKATDQAVRQFQQKKGLTVDGTVGAATRKALGI
jgi:lysozyme